MKLNIVEKALFYQSKGWYKISHIILSLFCIEIPKEVKFAQIGGADSVRLVHRAPGLVIHPNTSIGKRVRLYQNVTIGAAKPWSPGLGGVIVEDDVQICAGAVVLFKDSPLVVARGCVIGANSVLTQSTAENEIWAGVPVKKVGYVER